MHPYPALVGCTLLALSFAPAVTGQGSLDPPPGAPAPTMKTLDQIDAKLEKRTPISSLPFTISQSGSYYLTQNLTAAGAGAGILIDSSNVTIDLNGFSLSGGGVGDIAVQDAGEHQCVNVQNGTIRDWTSAALMSGGSFWVAQDLAVKDAGVIALAGHGRASRCRVAGGGITLSEGIVAECVVSYMGTGIGICGSGGCTVQDCRVDGANSGTGILIRGDLVRSVVIQGFSVGISVETIGEPATIENASVFGSATGVSAGNGTTISQCTLQRAFSAASGTGILGSDRVRVIDTVCAFFGTGIELGAGAHLSGCQATGNLANGIVAGESARITDCIAHNNGGSGISVGDGSTVRDCTVRQNSMDGIVATGGCMLVGNNCDANTGVSINATGHANRIEANTVLSSGSGIRLGGSHNIVIKNTLGTANPIVDVGGFNQIAPTQSAAGATNPFANIAH